MPIARRLLRFAVDCWGIALILAAWQALVVVNDLNAIVMPRPLDTILEVVRQPGLYAAATLQTVTTAAAGLAFGLLIGCGVALAAWASRILGGLLTPLGLIFSSVPVVTLIPVLARIFGYTSATVVAIVAILSFFPFFVYGSAGLADLPAGSDDLFRVLGARRRHRLAHLAGHRGVAELGDRAPHRRARQHPRRHGRRVLDGHARAWPAALHRRRCLPHRTGPRRQPVRDGAGDRGFQRGRRHRESRCRPRPMRAGQGRVPHLSTQ